MSNREAVPVTGNSNWKHLTSDAPRMLAKKLLCRANQCGGISYVQRAPTRPWLSFARAIAGLHSFQQMSFGGSMKRRCTLGSTVVLVFLFVSGMCSAQTYNITDLGQFEPTDINM